MGQFHEPRARPRWKKVHGHHIPQQQKINILVQFLTKLLVIVVKKVYLLALTGAFIVMMWLYISDKVPTF